MATIPKELARYQVIGLTKHGGLTTEYLARDQLLGQEVVVGIADRDRLAAIDIELFMHQSRLIASLTHPSIVPIYEVGFTDDVLYWVQQSTHGSLADVLDAKGKLPVTEALGVLGQVAQALDYAHSQGLIHRDVKPANILISPSNAILVDFGIASPLSLQVSASGLVGTPAYMSPEQVRGRPVMRASDLYSLGVTAYEMLTGQLPFVSNNPFEVTLSHVNEQPPRPSELTPDVGNRVDEVFLKVLAKDPANRYASAMEFVEALRNALEQDASATGKSRLPLTKIPGPKSLLGNQRAILIFSTLLTLTLSIIFAVLGNLIGEALSRLTNADISVAGVAWTFTFGLLVMLVVISSLMRRRAEKEQEILRQIREQQRIVSNGLIGSTTIKEDQHS